MDNVQWKMYNVELGQYIKMSQKVKNLFGFQDFFLYLIYEYFTEYITLWWDPHRTSCWWYRHDQRRFPETQECYPRKVWRKRNTDFDRTDCSLYCMSLIWHIPRRCSCEESPQKKTDPISFVSLGDLTSYQILVMSREVYLLSDVWQSPEELHHGWACRTTSWDERIWPISTSTK